MNEVKRHYAVLFALGTAAIVLFLLMSVLSQVSFETGSDASLVKSQVREGMIGFDVYLTFDDASVESGMVQVDGFRDDDPDYRCSIVGEFDGENGVCYANLFCNYPCDRYEVVGFFVTPGDGGLKDLYIAPMVLGFVCFFAASILIYRPVASVKHDGHIVSACQGFTSSKLKLDGKVIAKEKGGSVETLRAKVDGVSYSATFARPTRPSIYVDGNVISRPVSDRAKRYKFAFKIDIAAVVVLAIALIVCVVLPYVMPIDSTVKDGNFLYGIRYGGSDYYAYFLPTGTTPVKEGSISVDELDAEGEIVDSFRSHFEIGDSGVGEARIGSKTQGKLVLAGYSPEAEIDLTLPGALGTAFLLLALVALYYMKKNPVAGWTIDGHRVIAYVDDGRGHVTVDGELIGVSQSEKKGYGSVFGEVGSRRISVFFEKFKAPTLTAEGFEIDEEE